MLKTKEEIIDWLNKHKIENYIINKDLTVDVDGSVFLGNRNLKSIDVQFNIINGGFYCGYNYLSSLVGSPHKVIGNFNCNENELISLNGCPQSVGGDFNCRSNKLINVDGVSEVISGYFVCEDNEGLGDLQGVTSAEEIKKILEIRKNKKSLDSLLKINEEVKNKQKKI